MRISVQPVLDPHAALVRPRPQHADAGSHHHAKLDGFIRKVIATRLDLREIEHVIDHVEQMMAGRVDLHRIFDVVRADLAERLIANQLREANDGIQRRAQFVAHVGEEFRLGAARRLRTFLGVQKLGLSLHLGGDVPTGSAVAEECTRRIKQRISVDADVARSCRRGRAADSAGPETDAVLSIVAL